MKLLKESLDKWYFRLIIYSVLNLVCFQVLNYFKALQSDAYIITFLATTIALTVYLTPKRLRNKVIRK